MKRHCCSVLVGTCTYIHVCTLPGHAWRQLNIHNYISYSQQLNPFVWRHAMLLPWLSPTLTAIQCSWMWVTYIIVISSWLTSWCWTFQAWFPTAWKHRHVPGNNPLLLSTRYSQKVRAGQGKDQVFALAQVLCRSCIDASDKRKALPYRAIY